MREICGGLDLPGSPEMCGERCARRAPLSFFCRFSPVWPGPLYADCPLSVAGNGRVRVRELVAGCRMSVAGCFPPGNPSGSLVRKLRPERPDARKRGGAFLAVPPRRLMERRDLQQESDRDRETLVEGIVGGSAETPGGVAAYRPDDESASGGGMTAGSER